MTSRLFERARHALAPLVVASMILALGSPAIAADPVGVSGVVVDGTTSEPLVGARVHVASSVDGSIVSSEPTDADGRFEIAGVASGNYDLGVESNGGLYLVSGAIRLGEEPARPLMLSVSPAQSGGQEMPDGELVTEQKKQTGPFNNALTATLIVVGSVAVLAYIFDQAFNDDDDPSTLPPPVSPSTLAD